MVSVIKRLFGAAQQQEHLDSTALCIGDFSCVAEHIMAGPDHEALPEVATSPTFNRSLTHGRLKKAHSLVQGVLQKFRQATSPDSPSHHETEGAAQLGAFLRSQLGLTPDFFGTAVSGALSKELLVRKLTLFFSSSTASAVLVMYCGGSDGSGNWAVEHTSSSQPNVLMFAELAQLWQQHSKTQQHLVIISDCVGSGAWVQTLQALPRQEQVALSISIQASDSVGRGMTATQPAVHAPGSFTCHFLAYHLQRAERSNPSSPTGQPSHTMDDPEGWPLGMDPSSYSTRLTDSLFDLGLPLVLCRHSTASDSQARTHHGRSLDLVRHLASRTNGSPGGVDSPSADQCHSLPTSNHQSSGQTSPATVMLAPISTSGWGSPLNAQQEGEEDASTVVASVGLASSSHMYYPSGAAHAPADVTLPLAAHAGCGDVLQRTSTVAGADQSLKPQPLCGGPAGDSVRSSDQGQGQGTVLSSGDGGVEEEADDDDDDLQVHMQRAAMSMRTALLAGDRQEFDDTLLELLQRERRLQERKGRRFEMDGDESIERIFNEDLDSTPELSRAGSMMMLLVPQPQQQALSRHASLCGSVSTPLHASQAGDGASFSVGAGTLLTTSGQSVSNLAPPGSATSWLAIRSYGRPASSTGGGSGQEPLPVGSRLQQSGRRGDGRDAVELFAVLGPAEEDVGGSVARTGRNSSDYLAHRRSDSQAGALPLPPHGGHNGCGTLAPSPARLSHLQVNALNNSGGGVSEGKGATSSLRVTTLRRQGSSISGAASERMERTPSLLLRRVLGSAASSVLGDADGAGGMLITASSPGGGGQLRRGTDSSADNSPVARANRRPGRFEISGSNSSSFIFSDDAERYAMLKQLLNNGAVPGSASGLPDEPQEAS